MASIIKNQLIKHLSKFTRNLKPEQISVDVLRGNSKLKNIEINEEVLSDILELPSWLRIKKACCCGVTVNVPWTRLKTSPIQIFVDEIFVTVELVSGRAKRGENPFANMADNSSYGFANKVVENMSLFINSVEINFDSDEFGGSFTLSRLSVVSKSPGWQTANDLRLTRITCSATNRTLMYKQISWQLLRVEASAKTSKDEQRSKINAPLRLITSGGKIRVALKKSSIDGSVIHARIQTIMEDILWVATLPQLRSAIAFSSYIMSLVKEAQKEVVLVPTPAGASSHRPRSSEAPLSDSSSNAFKMFYFDQTSYHLHVNKIDLHLCDDANITNKYPPGWDIESGAMQVTLYRVLIDIYPKTLAKSDRSTWMHYQPANVFTQWMHKRLDDQFLELIKAIKDDTSRTRLERCWPQLMGFHVVVRIYDVIVQCVSDKNTKKDALKDLFVSERHARALPTDQYVVHFELASYFHPMTDTLPVPKLAMYLQMGPFSLTFDERTLRWCLYVAHNLGEAIEDGNLTPKIDTTAPKPDIRIDLLMPKLVFPLPTPTNDARLPLRLLISMSTLSISSCDFEASQRFHVQPFAGAVEALDFLHGKKEFMEHVAHIQLGSTPIESEKFFLRTSPVWIDTDHGNFTKGLPLINDVSFCGVMIADLKNLSVYVEATDEITLIIDHFQFLQVTRFASKIGEFFEILSADQKHFTGEKPSSGPCVFFLANIEKIRAHVFLTMGSMASPYDSCPAITDATTNSSFMERLSEMAVNTRSSTPRPTPNEKVTNNTQQERFEQLDFPEFPPRPSSEIDVQYADDSASIATSAEDDSAFDLEITVVDEDPFGAETAAEAVTIDANILNDRIYKSTMARVGNILIANLSSTSIVGNVHESNLKVFGNVKEIEVKYQLKVLRQEINEMLKKSPVSTPAAPPRTAIDVVKFELNSPANMPTSFLEAVVEGLQAELDDEIIAHLSPFALDDHVSDNKLRLKVAVKNSNIQIVDRKKKKPLRVRIRDCIIEQDED